MATFLRDFSYRYLWFYDTIAGLSTLAVGGIDCFHELPLRGLTIAPDSRILDLCCGAGQATGKLLARSPQVTGLDASPRSLAAARQRVPAAAYVEAFAEQMPFADGSFDLVHTSAALHEMTADSLAQILAEVHRVLRPGGQFVLVDFHPPRLPVMWPGLALFFWLFETETSWSFIRRDLSQDLRAAGFGSIEQTLYAGGSLQVLQTRKPDSGHKPTTT